MFAHVLAVLLGVGSVGFYVAAFFYPEVHRRSDVLLSGAGMLYAALLWFCAGQMTAVVLLTQMVAIALLMVLGWQTLSVRREKTPVYQQTPMTITPELVGDWAKNTINRLRIAPADKVRPLRPQNPSLNGTSADRFRQPIDPRRRPVYDYEFVEDGVADDVSAESVDDISALVDTVPDVVPPSAEAEVIDTEVLTTDAITQTPEAKSVQQVSVSEVKEGVGQEQLAISETSAPMEMAEEVAPEEVGFKESDFKKTDSEDTDSRENNSKRDDSTPADDLPTEVSIEPHKKESSDKEGFVEDSGDWNFLEDDFEDASVHSETAQKSSDRFLEKSVEKSSLKVAEKPAVWTIPIILVGWIKDVFLSMTKPKPSKPIIEIPRRDSVSAARAGEGTVGVEDDLEDYVESTVVEDIAVEDSAVADSNEANFDDREEDNFDGWMAQSEEVSESASGSTADIPVSASANESIEESNWDD